MIEASSADSTLGTDYFVDTYEEISPPQKKLPFSEDVLIAGEITAAAKRKFYLTALGSAGISVITSSVSEALDEERQAPKQDYRRREETFSSSLPTIQQVNRHTSIVTDETLPFEPLEQQRAICCYNELSTAADEAVIYQMMDTMNKKSVWWLGWNRGYMNTLGDRIDHVHPLKTLGYMLKTPHIKTCLRGIYGTYFKRTGFLFGDPLTGKAGITQKLAAKNRDRDIYHYLEAFASETGMNIDTIQAYVDRNSTNDINAWAEFITYLVNN